MNSQPTQTPVSTVRASEAQGNAEENARRAGLYSVIAALLRDTPDAATLEYMTQLQDTAADQRSELPLALNMLALAARHTEPGALRDEYHALFIGLGRGELVPYGSWYQTGFLMEKPLGLLRADLAALGFERDSDVHEPEDHIAALCEVMAMLISDGATLSTQQRFFNNHLGNWAQDFFADLKDAESAVFYKSVARLGTAFIAIESNYLSLLD